MKREILIPTIIIFLIASANAQDRPRTYDNGVSRGETVKVAQTSSGSASSRNAVVQKELPKHYLPSPLYGEKYQKALSAAAAAAPTKLVEKTAKTTLRVNDGYVEPRIIRTVQNTSLMVGTGYHLKGLSTGDMLVDSYIVESSRRYGIDPLLIYAQMAQESSFKRMAKSHKGASGLMQLMPATARRLGVTDIYDTKQNIEGGVKYMRMLLNMFGQDLNLALAGYNAGEGAVMKYGNRIPPYNETQDYVRRISARYQAISAPTVARFVNKPTDLRTMAERTR